MPGTQSYSFISHFQDGGTHAYLPNQSAQKAFEKQENNLADVIRRMGNPFLDDFPELVTLDSRDCMDDAVTLLQVGKTQYQEYLKEVIKHRTISINSPIKKNKLPLFSKQPSCTKSKQSKRWCSYSCRPVTGVIIFDDHAESVFIPYICSQSSKSGHCLGCLCT